MHCAGARTFPPFRPAPQRPAEPGAGCLGLPDPPSPHLCPPSSEHKHRMSVPAGEVHQAPKPPPGHSHPAPDSRAGAAGCTPGVSPPRPLVHIQGQGKTTESNAKLCDHRKLWARADTVQKTRQSSSTEARRPGGWAPPELTVSVTSRSLPRDLLHSTPAASCSTSHPTGVGEGQLPDPASSSQRPHQLPRHPVPSLLPKKALL